MDAIANHIWQSTIFALAAGMLALMFRNNSASVRYWIWFAAAMKFLVPLAALTAVANRLPLPQRPQAAGRCAAKPPPLCFARRRFPAMAATTSVIRPRRRGCRARSSSSTRCAWQWQRLAADARQLAADGGRHRLRHAQAHRARRGHQHARWRSWRRVNSIEPGVIGIWKPVLLWPQHLTARTQRHAHRNGRLRMRCVTSCVATICSRRCRCSSPLSSGFTRSCGGLARRLVDERERACDERVLALGGRPATYAESILKTCQLCLPHRSSTSRESQAAILKQRIVRIMKQRTVHARLTLDGRRALLVTALVLVLLPTAAGISACKNDEGPRTTQAVPVQAPAGRRPRSEPSRRERHHAQAHPRSRSRTTRERAMQEKVQGEVLMECVVKADGTVGDKKIVEVTASRSRSGGAGCCRAMAVRARHSQRQTCQMCS